MCPRRRRRPSRDPQGSRNLSDVLYPTLDLHGKTEAEAVRSVQSWLERSFHAGEGTVRVITGRGLHSIGPAVLPAIVEALLGRLKGSLVQSFERDAGGGAYTIHLLRTSEPTPQAPAPRPIAASPAVLRQAEENLFELGVQPTPALIQKEVERILAERKRR